MTLIKTTVSNQYGEVGRWFFASEQDAEKAVCDLRDTLQTNLCAVLETKNVPHPLDPAPQPAVHLN